MVKTTRMLGRFSLAGAAFIGTCTLSLGAGVDAQGGRRAQGAEAADVATAGPARATKRSSFGIWSVDVAGRERNRLYEIESMVSTRAVGVSPEGTFAVAGKEGILLGRAGEAPKTLCAPPTNPKTGRLPSNHETTAWSGRPDIQWAPGSRRFLISDPLHALVVELDGRYRVIKSWRGETTYLELSEAVWAGNNDTALVVPLRTTASDGSQSVTIRLLRPPYENAEPLCSAPPRYKAGSAKLCVSADSTTICFFSSGADYDKATPDVRCNYGIWVWRRGHDKLTQLMEASFPVGAEASALSPNGRFFAACIARKRSRGYDNRVVLGEVATGKVCWESDMAADCLAFNSTSDKLAFGGLVGGERVLCALDIPGLTQSSVTSHRGSVCFERIVWSSDSKELYYHLGPARLPVIPVGP